MAFCICIDHSAHVQVNGFEPDSVELIVYYDFLNVMCGFAVIVVVQRTQWYQSLETLLASCAMLLTREQTRSHKTFLCVGFHFLATRLKLSGHMMAIEPIIV